LHKNLTSEYESFANRRLEHDLRQTVSETAEKGLATYEEKMADLKETKTWITDEEWKDVIEKIADMRIWLKEQNEA